MYDKDTPYIPSMQQSKRGASRRKAGVGNDKKSEWPVLNFGIKARVDKINIDGLERTKEDYVVDKVKELFKAGNFQEVLVGAQRVREKLEALGCFQSIGIFIDESRGSNSSPDGFEVTFQVQEVNSIVGGVNTLIGNDEGGVSVGLQMPNMFGRGEKLLAEYSYGTKNSSGLNLSFKKPFKGHFYPLLTATLFQRGSEWPWSGYKQLDKGVLLDYSYFTPYLLPIKHSFQWEAAWRQLSCLSKDIAFPVREEAGHSLKSSLHYILSVDTRDAQAFPNKGCLFRLSQELAGLGGNVNFLKHELKCEGNFSLMPAVVIQGTFHGGIMAPKGKILKANICDNFFLGGPLSIRGFRTRGTGPHENKCALGGNAYWAAGLHLFTPLPFFPGSKGWTDLFRIQFFLNAGSLNHGDTGKIAELWRNVSKEMRAAYGVGLAMRLGSLARVELNYCVPLYYKSNDLLNAGFQFGISLEFL